MIKKHLPKLCALTGILLLSFVCALAQDGDTVSIEKDKHGNITFAKFKRENGGRRKLTDGNKFLKDMLNANDDFEFRIKKDEHEGADHRHIRYQQYYKGLQVEHAEYLLHSENDEVAVMNGHFANVKVDRISPSMTEQNALQSALSFVGAKKYSWEEPGMEEFIKENKKAKSATYFPDGELVISKDYRTSKEEWKLTWKFSISAIEPFSSQVVYVDAHTGEILNSESNICHTNAPGTAQTRYSGTRAVTTDSYTGGFRLREIRNNVDVQTLNLRSSTLLSAAVDFSDNDNNWTAAEHNNMAEDQIALDAHWGAEVVLDYFKTVHGRSSLDGNGFRIKSFVHFDHDLDNAMWLSNEQVMVYGDGSSFSPLTTLDICAHEFGHGVTRFESNLAYQKESGALNESLSDIWGAIIENWAAPEKEHWLIGEEINNGRPLRSMSNPNQFNQPDTYGGALWFTQNCTPAWNNDYCGVHINSGVMNYWFFLLSDGGSGTNDLGNSFNTTGVGIQTAAKIIYRAQTYYLTSSSDFMAARTATIQAASDLYGASSETAYRVAYCWWAVGVGRSPLRYNGDLQGPTQLTPGYTASYFINPPAGATKYVWTIPSGCYYSYCWSLMQGQGTNQIVVKAGKTGSNQEISCKIYNASGQLIRNPYILVNVQSSSGGGSGGGGGSDPCDPMDGNAFTFSNGVIYPPEPCDANAIRSSDLRFNEIGIYNFGGFRVKHATDVFEMSINNLPRGMYVIKAHLSNGKVITTKISKE